MDNNLFRQVAEKTGKQEWSATSSLKQYEAILKKAFISYASNKLGRTFDVDNSNKHALSLLFSHLILKEVLEDDKDDLKRNLSLKKGFLILGDLGSGKSTLMKMLSDFMRDNNAKTFKFITSLEVCQHYKISGSIDRFTFNEEGVSGRPATFCIDELGREPRVIDHYGTKLDVISQILQVRYSLWQDKGIITHMITNLNFDEIKSTYGDFILDRIVEMCNVIEINGKNRRIN